MRRASYLILLYVIAAALPAMAQRAFPPALAERLRVALEELRTSTGIVGVTAAIVTPQYGEWAGVAGMSHPGNKTPLDPTMLFGIGSITKTMTSAAILQLAAEGKLALDDTIGSYISKHPRISGAITIRQLLQHTSGLYDYTASAEFWGSVMADPERRFTGEEILDYVGTPYFSPGFSWRYCNTGYALLGIIIENVTGNSYEAELESRFFAPLGLRSTAIGWLDKLPGTVPSHWFDLDGDGVADDMSLHSRRSMYSGAWAAGGFVSTALDVATWGSKLYGGRVLSPASMQQMLTFRTVPSMGPNVGYGLGVIRNVLGGRTVWGHSGGIPGFSSVLLYAPSDSLSIAVIVNESTDVVGAIASRLMQVYFANAAANGDLVHESKLSAHPNPFTDRTSIVTVSKLHAGARAHVYNAIGERIRTLPDLLAGAAEIVWDGRDDSGELVPASTYIVHIHNGTERSTVTVIRR